MVHRLPAAAFKQQNKPRNGVSRNSRAPTNNRSTSTTPSTSRAMAATGINPSMSIQRAPPNPSPVPVYSDKWVKRIYASTKNEASPASGVDFLQSSFAAPTAYYVDKIQIWYLPTGNSQTSSAANAGTGLSTTYKQGASTDLGNDDVTAEDWGTANALAGVTFKVPLGHAKQIANTGSTVLASAKNIIAPIGNNSVFVAHLHCWVAV